MLPQPMPLARRFIDAVTWYGEAVRDKFAASRLVKYVIAMERLLITAKTDRGGDDKIAEVFRTRGAALTSKEGRAAHQAEIGRYKKVYDLRCDLVHGSRSPSEKGLAEGLINAEWLARSCLISFLQIFSKKLNEEKLSDNRLDNAFSKLIEHRGLNIDG